MKIVLANIMIMFGLLSCSSKSGKVIHQLPITNQDSLQFNIGDAVAFKIDSNVYSAGIIDEISKDEAGIWHKIIFTDLQTNKLPEIKHLISSKVFGRKILSGIDEKGFVYGLDGEFISDTCLRNNHYNFEIIGKLRINKALSINGSYGPSTEYKNFIDRYRDGIDIRKLPPDDYRDFLNAKRTEEYFQLKDFILIN